MYQETTLKPFISIQDKNVYLDAGPYPPECREEASSITPCCPSVEML